jgi:hypothetical protein
MNVEMSGIPHSLALDIGIHLVSAVVLLCLFSAKNEKASFARIFVFSLLFVLLNIGIQKFLAPWLHEGSLVFMWVLMVLLANKVAKLPLLFAMTALFCHFSLMLGYGLLPDIHFNKSLSPEDEMLLEGFDRNPDPTSESEDATTDSPSWENDIRDLLLHQTLVNANTTLREVIYPTKTTGIAAATPTPPPPLFIEAPEPTVQPVPPPMTQAEFLAHFDDNSTANVDPIPTPTPLPQPPRATPEPGEITGENVVKVEDAVTVNSNQLNQMVQIRNHSTDKRFLPPEFKIGAVGMGSNGKYAIIDQRFVKEGMIIRVTDEQTRGWRLVRIEQTELFWQPLL